MNTFENKKAETLYKKMKKYYMTEQMVDAYENEIITYEKLVEDCRYCYDWILRGTSEWDYENSNDVNLKAFLKRFLAKEDVKEVSKKIY